MKEYTKEKTYYRFVKMRFKCMDIFKQQKLGFLQVVIGFFFFFFFVFFFFFFFHHHYFQVVQQRVQYFAIVTLLLKTPSELQTTGIQLLQDTQIQEILTAKIILTFFGKNFPYPTKLNSTSPFNISQYLASNFYCFFTLQYHDSASKIGTTQKNTGSKP
eukprot:TRINITY_DN4837_c0_g1_i11.p1 TRINITY_DN4837_c0_g1~~TRINITY_DN4837_c0_g1_i11.p1  ORF type:complete len:159 (-),score=1.65 TRINITY_DN4837_c0_g1_i11:870-1346(-)